MFEELEALKRLVDERKDRRRRRGLELADLVL